MTKTDDYGLAIQTLIDKGMGSMEAAKQVAEEKGIATGTATAALYRWRKRSGHTPEREATRGRRRAIEDGGPMWVPPRGRPTDWEMPTELAEILRQLNAAQAAQGHLIDALVTWASKVDGEIDERALAMIRAAAKK